MLSSYPRTACTEKVCEVQHTAHTHCTNTVHDIATLAETSHRGRHNILNKNLTISRSVHSSSSTHRSTVMRKTGDLSESHFHLWIKTPLSCITTSLVMIHGASFTIPRPSLRWLGENNQHIDGKLNVYRKVMLETFFDSRNIIYKEFIPVAVTITEDWYAQELCSLWEAIHQKQLDMWLLIPGCHCILVWQELTNHGNVVLSFLPHSPDITPCDFFLFAQLNKILHNCHFKNADITATTLDRKRCISAQLPRPRSPLAEMHYSGQKLI
jgi:hypothetical protein